MAIFRLATATRNAVANAIADLLDAGAAGGTLKIYSGAVPANGDTEGTGLLATVALPDPAFPDAVAGALTVDPSAVSISGSGNAASFVLEDSNGANVGVGDVTATGGGGTLTLATVALAAGGTLDITSFTITAPAGA